MKYLFTTESQYVLIWIILIFVLKYSPIYHWIDSAPYRVTTVRDALSDLPRIKSGFNEEISNYGSEPASYFQRKVLFYLISFIFKTYFYSVKY